MDWRLFVHWCRDDSLESLPASDETVVYYLTSLSQTSKASTIKRKMTAISQRHETENYASPTKTPLVQGVWNDALWLHDLRRLVHVLPSSRIGIRDHALLVIGWAGAFRRSELVALYVEDVQFTQDGLIIQIGKSKMDQTGAGQEVALPYGSNPLTCPIRSLKEWLMETDIKEGPVFRCIDRHGNLYDRLTAQSVRLIVQKFCKEVGLPFEAFGAHSLRSGFCSSAAKAEKTEHQIMKQTRHKQSSSLQRYIKLGTIFEDNAASGIGL